MWALAAETCRTDKPNAQAAQCRTDKPDAQKVLTADQVIRGKVEGDARVELEVQGWVKLMGLSNGPDEWRPLVLKQEAVGEALEVIVGPKVFKRLRALGIADPHAHFVGKTVVVSGKVLRGKTPLGGPAVGMWVEDLSQVELISKK